MPGIAVAFSLGMFLLIGCGSDEADQGAMRATSERGTFEVLLRPTPAPIPFNETFGLHVEVFRVGVGTIASDVEVVVDARMPQHGHGMTVKPATTKGKDGAFFVEGMLLHMPGSWELYVDVTRAGESERTLIPLEVTQAGATRRSQ